MPDPYGYSERYQPAKVPFAAVALLFLAVVGAACLNSPYFLVERVEVVGARYLSEAEVLVMAGLPERANIFWVPVREVERRRMGAPRIAAARVRRWLPQTIVIEVEERDTVAYMPYAGYFVDLDAEGYAIALSEAIADPDTPLLVGVRPTYVAVAEQVRPDGPVRLGAMVGQALAARNVPMVSEIDVSGISNIVVRTTDGIRIMLGAAEGIESRLNVADSILASVREQGAKVDYIDVRVETRPVMGNQ